MTSEQQTIKSEQIEYLLLGVNKETKQPIVENLSLQTSGGTVLPEPSDDDVLYVRGEDVGHKGLVIKTSGKEIKEMIKFAEKKKRMGILKIMKHLDEKIKSTNLDEIYPKRDEFEKFCSDIVDYYCFRYRVFNIPMPVCDFDPSQMTQ